MYRSGAPESSAMIFSASRSRAEGTMIGIFENSRASRKTSLPSMSGSPKSKTTMSGAEEAIIFSASRPVAAARTS